MTAVAEERVTVAELARRFDRFEREWKDDLDIIGRKIDGLSFVHPDTLATQLLLVDAHRSELERRVGTLESNNQWLWRTLAGMILAAVLAAVLAAAGLPS